MVESRKWRVDFSIFEAVILTKVGIQFRKTGFRVKPGMTSKTNGLLTQYTMSCDRGLPKYLDAKK